VKSVLLSYWPEAHISSCPLEHHGAYAFCVDAYAVTYLPQSSKAPGSAAESAKSFIAGGFGGISAVLVGSSSPYQFTIGRYQFSQATRLI
jgi:hypothetical protein